MTETIRFGKLETIHVEGDTIVIVEENVHDYITTSQLRRYTRKVFGNDTKTVTAEALKLIDKLKEDDVTDITFEARKQTSKSRYQIAVCWTVR